MRGAWIPLVLAGALGCTQPAPRVHEVVIEGFVYKPARLEIQAGDTVRWINRDFVPHTSTATDRTWDSGTIARDSAWSTADNAGEYFCAFHTNMRGVVVVR